MTTEEELAALKAELSTLRKLVELLQKESAQLRLENAHLKERLGLNSDNSSLPPSKSPPPKRGLKSLKPKRKRGGQSGHPGAFRELLSETEVTYVILLKPDTRCSCGANMQLTTSPRRHQFYEMPHLELETYEYQLYSAICKCGERRSSELPPGVLPGMMGPRLLSWCGILTTQCHMSRQKVCDLLAEMFELKISAGTLSSQENYLVQALKYPYLQLQEWLKEQVVLYVDETGWKESDSGAWVWTAVSDQATLLKIQLRRSQACLQELVGHSYQGVICSDRFSSYKLFDESQRALCWAHLLRDFQRMSERSGSSKQIGRNLVKQTSHLFNLWQRFKSNEIGRSELKVLMEPIQETITNSLTKGSKLIGGSKSAGGKTRGTCRQILKVRNALWTFLEKNVEPTNNMAERALRKVVVSRKIQYGTQSERGSRFVERMQSAVETCRQQTRSAWKFCEEALQAHFSSLNYPSLIPVT